MTQILAGAEMAKQIEAATGPVNIVDENGTVIAVCTPIKFPHPPYSREEIERRRDEARKNPEKGMKLAEFWKRMEQLGGEQP